MIKEIFGFFRCIAGYFTSYKFRHKSKMSKGEKFIDSWLKKNKVKYYNQFYVYLDEVARNARYALIDFMVICNGRKYFIEYNGRQHYEYVPYFHSGGEVDFVKQQRRDQIVRDYCKENDIILIEIPYTMSESQISELLWKTFKTVGNKI